MRKGPFIGPFLFPDSADSPLIQIRRVRQRRESYFRVFPWKVAVRASKSATDQKPNYRESLVNSIRANREGTAIADDVWLPIRFDGANPVIDWHDEWRVEGFA